MTHRRGRPRRRPHELPEARTRLIEFIRRATDGLVGEDQAEQLLRRAKAWGTTGAYGLDAHLSEHPDAFLAPQQHCPAPLPKLLRLLDAQGLGEKVVLLGCARCGRTDDDLRRSTPQGRCCARCMLRDRQIECARCHRTVSDIAARRAEGPICRRCHYSDPERAIECSRCGRRRPPRLKLPDGGALCSACRPKPRTLCVRCGRLRVADARTAEGPICGSCHKSPARTCGICGDVKPITLRATADNPDVCHGCYRNDTKCAICGETTQKCANWPVGAVCFRCHRHRTHHPAPCGSCGHTRVLVGVNDSGPICASCAGSDLNYTCRQCGHEGDIYAKRRCRRCVAVDHVRELITGANGHIVPELLPLADALANAKSASLMKWVKSSRSSQRLAELVASGPDIRYQALDQLPQGHATRYLRELLVSTGVLEPRNESFAQLVLWEDRTISALSDHHQRIVRPFAKWAVIRDARRRTERGRYTDAASRADRAQIRAAIGFLAWLDTVETSVERIDQRHLDTYLSQNPAKLEPLTAFLRWIRDRGPGSVLALTARQSAFGPAKEFQEFEEYQNQLRRCLTDDSLPLDLRVAGALIRLYGMSLDHIVELTKDRFRRADERDAYLTIDKHPVLLPPSLTRLIEQLIGQPVTRALLPAVEESPYLFPGKPPTRPRHTRSLRQSLADNRLPSLSARNTAMMTIIAELPPVVVSDLLGIHPGTAARWAQFAQSGWADYLAARGTSSR